MPTYWSSLGQFDASEIDPNILGSIGSIWLANRQIRTDTHIETHPYTRTQPLTDREPILATLRLPPFLRAFYSLWRRHLHRGIKAAWHLNAATLHLHTLGGRGATQQINKSWLQRTGHFISSPSTATRVKGSAAQRSSEPLLADGEMR